MFLNSRMESKELLRLRSLNTRMILAPNDKKYYFNLEKGFEGEKEFDQLTQKLQNDFFIINDLRLEFNNSEFQFDTLIIAQETIYPFEVKNHEGDYYYESGNFYSLLTKDEVKNPLDQLKRSKSLFCPLLKKMGITAPVEGFVTFVNPVFTLYQAPINAPIIYPTQLKSLMNKLEQIPSKLNVHHKRLADQLISMHLYESRYTRIPSYRYEQLKKGVICPICFSFMMSFGDKKLVCKKCLFEESVDSGVMRSVKEFVLLFPDRKITTISVHDWCGVIKSAKVIRRILMQNYTSIGARQHRYFE
ncbi:NERD domain-containing protein [Bacillus sp. S3]|uniref:nuclease-related domain-containing protein n=1 Tax=Bacillus sp. S3 TaxID=486398 RepID=UPI00118A183F|nr:NERD domain-containing protein [Bacillus sp. S3]QCJ43584.1 NERD domain-containing protein [Bacillus sp. S3]